MRPAKQIRFVCQCNLLKAAQFVCICDIVRSLFNLFIVVIDVATYIRKYNSADQREFGYTNMIITFPSIF